MHRRTWNGDFWPADDDRSDLDAALDSNMCGVFLMVEVIGILGGSGFIGSHLVQHLRQLDYQVVTLPRIDSSSMLGPRLDRYSFGSSAEIQLAQAIDSGKVSTVINLAWDGLPDYGPETTAWNAMLNVLIQQSWARSNAERFVGFGSCFEYGKARGAIEETDSGVAVSFFGKTKSWLLNHLETLEVPAGKTHLWIRPFWLYGPGQRASSLLPSALRSAKDGKAFSPKTPDAFVDFLYIDDLSSAVSSLLETQGAAGIINVGSGRALRVGEVAKMVFSAVNGSEPVHLSQPNRYSDASWSTNRRLKELTSWKLGATFEGRLEKFLREEQER